MAALTSLVIRGDSTPLYRDLHFRTKARRAPVLLGQQGAALSTPAAPATDPGRGHLLLQRQLPGIPSSDSPVILSPKFEFSTTGEPFLCWVVLDKLENRGCEAMLFFTWTVCGAFWQQAGPPSESSKSPSGPSTGWVHSSEDPMTPDNCLDPWEPPGKTRGLVMCLV